MVPSPTRGALLTQRAALTLAAAQLALAACIAHAERIGVPVNISIYDASLHLLAFARMDGAKLTSIDIAHNKAFTAAGHRAPTDVYTKEKVGPGGPLYGVNHSNEGKFTTIGGGMPIEYDGVCVGAIGEIAFKGIDALAEALGHGSAVVRARL